MSTSLSRAGVAEVPAGQESVTLGEIRYWKNLHDHQQI